jgi:hypothetical protein
MTQRAGVSFELERLALEGGDLVVSGRWSGAQDVRFVRPALLVDGDRRILATLEHKPWAPSDDGTWTAAFPWTGGSTVDAGSLALSVSPQVTASLDANALAAPATPSAPPEAAAAAVREAAAAPKATAAPKAAAAPSAGRASKAAVSQASVASASKPASATKAARAPKAASATKTARAPKAARAAKPAPAPAASPAATAPASNGAAAAAPPVPPDVRGDELARALAAAERDRDRALEQLAEAVAARDAARRDRARMQVVHDEALQAREAAETALAGAQVEREDVARQRDEALLAFETLRRRLQTERAQEHRALRGEPDPDTPADEPLGVRSVPAVRTVLAELQLPPRQPKRRLTRFDLWVVRLLGLAAASCFFVLLYSILRLLV